jgi:hypothetical protein
MPHDRPPARTADTKGRPWAKLSELYAGAMVELDGGFPCHAPGRVQIQAGEYGLYFECSDGHHYLIGQADDGVHCMGVYRVVS